MKGVKGVIGTNFQLKINKSWDVMYSMVTVVSNTTMNEIMLFAALSHFNPHSNFVVRLIILIL